MAGYATEVERTEQREEVRRDSWNDSRPASFGSQATTAPNDRTPRVETDTTKPDFSQQPPADGPSRHDADSGRGAGQTRSSGRGDRRQERYRNGRPTWEVLDHIGRLSTSSSGWTREVNIVAWNGAAPRLDVRDWSPDRMKMSRGIGLNREETENLRALLNSFDPRQAGI